ncbi:DUF1990 family protein [Humidisolicoccus flavus]|uniref:DUF1990 family protein n=1 Tax=Humidisolicoccus flavus TaxID=3111414 RepID=UPI00324D24E0
MKDLSTRPINYAAIGATAHRDFTRFPPGGYRVETMTARIGHGRARYVAAVAGLRTWKVQRLSGIEVDVVHSADPAVYRPVGFEGNDPTRSAAFDVEPVFDPDGEEFLQPGTSANQRIKFMLGQVHAPVRVIAVEDEPDMHAVIFGALRGHPVAGEERMLIEIRADESVWFSFSAFSKPAKWWSRLGAPFMRRKQKQLHQRFLDALRQVPTS